MNTNSQNPNKNEAGSDASASVLQAEGSTDLSRGYSEFHEIDLVDIGVIFWRHRMLILSVFLVCFLLTIGETVFKKPAYEYTTTIALATSISEASGSVVPLMSAQSAAQTLQATYIPNAIYQYIAQNHLGGSQMRMPKITATGAANDSTVTLDCEAIEKMGPMCVAMENLAAEAFVKDAAMFVETAKNQLASLQNEAKALQIQLDQMNELETAYSASHRANANSGNTSLSAHGRKAGKTTGVDASVSSNDILGLISDAQTQSVRAQVLSARAQVLKQLADNYRAQLSQEQSIAQAQTRVMNAGLRSLQPVGLSRRIVFALGILLSLCLAGLAAMVAGYIAQVRVRLES